MTEKDLEIQDLRRENESLKAQLAAAKATPEVIHKPTVSEVQLGYAPVVRGQWNGEGDGYAECGAKMEGGNDNAED